VLIDTHCHLNLSEHFPDPGAEVELALEAGVEKMIVVGIDDDTSKTAVSLADRYEPVYACVGWHPTSAANFVSVNLVEELSSHPKTVAIGEIGLDYHWDYSTPEQQRISLDTHWDLACRMGLPVVFHCREAYDDLLDWLDAQTFEPPASIFHCFSGDFGQARRASGHQCYFGVDGPITYKNANSLRETIAKLPIDRLLLETDSPYLTPHPHRGKFNSPAMLPLICEGLAKSIGSTVLECSRITTENALRAFPLLG
jgi:TatD DNase family protein